MKRDIRQKIFYEKFIWQVATPIYAQERAREHACPCSSLHCVVFVCVDRCQNITSIIVEFCSLSNIFAMSWPNELSLEFIMLYKQEPVLWNLKYPNAKNRTAVTEAWNRIRSALNVDISITDLKKKKESLMTSYRSNVKKKLDSDGKYNIQWFGFDLMDSFLADIYSPNEKVSILIYI